jgi:hypothetical protein
MKINHAIAGGIIGSFVLGPNPADAAGSMPFPDGRRRYNERRSYSQEVLPAIKMLIGDWYVDELGVLTREITARD